MFVSAQQTFILCEYDWQITGVGDKQPAPDAATTYFSRYNEICVWESGSNNGNEIAKAYIQHGTEAARRLSLGGSFVLYDEARGIVLAVRDFMGNYPLYYHVSSTQVSQYIFSFSLNALLEMKGTELTLNHAKVVEYVQCEAGLAPNDQTFFQNTYRLLPAHLFLIEAGARKALYAYGKFDLEKYRDWTDEAYIRRFEELFVESVQKATRSYGKVAASLSGGLDSSAVCAVAQSLRAEPVCTFNFDTRTDEAREDDYVAAVVNKWQLDHRTVEATHGGYDAIRQLTRSSGQPLFLINYSNHLDLMAAARQQGCTVFLSGHWGDQVVSHGLFYLKELAAKGDWTLLEQAVRHHFDHSFFMVPQGEEATPAGKRRAINYFTVQLVAGSRPHKNWQQWPAIAGILLIRFGFSATDLWDFIRQRFATKKLALAFDDLLRPDVLTAAAEQPSAQKLDTADLVNDPLNPAQQQYLRSIYQNNEVYGQEEFFEIYRDNGLRSAQPFVDEALIELNLSVPPRLKFDEGRKRGTLRRALASYLPPEVANRVTKGVFSQYHLAEFRKLYQEFSVKTPGHHLIWSLVDRSAFERQVQFVLTADRDASAASTARRAVVRVIMLAIWLDVWKESKRASKVIES